MGRRKYNVGDKVTCKCGRSWEVLPCSLEFWCLVCKKKFFVRKSKFDKEVK